MTEIERKRLIRAPLSRVWNAIADAEQFGEWFRLKADGEFRPGARVDVVSTYPGHEGTKFFLDIVEVTPQTVFSFRWQHDNDEPMTLVTFRLEPAEEGTMLTITESGFDAISLARRKTFYERNSEGWSLQIDNIERYVTGKRA
jgi:uncharacterized protein YndB with AHSA1/START domain